MSAISGMLSLAAGPSTNEWVSEYQEAILVRNAKGFNVGTTLFGLMSRLKNENAETTEYKWFERDPVRRTVYINNGGTAYDGSTTTIVLDDSAGNAVDGIIQVGTVLRTNDANGELLRVTAVNGSSSFDVERGFGGTTNNGTLSNNATLSIITLGKSEGATPATAVYETAENMENYIQTFNSTVELTNAFKGSKLRTDIEGPLRERRVQALERVARDIEMAYLFGHKVKKTSASLNQYFTGGIKYAVDQHAPAGNSISGSSGAVTVANLHTWLETFMTVGSENKLALSGPKAYSAISRYANDAANGFRITGQENVWGMNITSINTPFGELNLAMHPLMKEIAFYNDWMVVVDLGLICQKVMEPLFLERNIQTPGQDSYKEQFRAKYGLKLKFAEAFGYVQDFETVTSS